MTGRISKIISKVWQRLLVFPAFFIALGMRILRPFVIVRLGRIDITRIGGICCADWYMSFLNGQQHQRNYFDIFYYHWTSTICNDQWWRMWKRVIRVVPFGVFAKSVQAVSQVLPGNKSHVVPMNDVSPATMVEHKDKLKYLFEHKKPNIG